MKKKEAGKDVISYALVPTVFNPGKLRFIFATHNMEVSGFHVPMSVKEANAIMGYFRKGILQNAEDNPSWVMAKSIFCCAHDDVQAKEQKRRQTLERAVRGLIPELAFVLKISVTEAVSQVRKCLECAGQIGPLVLSALNNVGRD